MYCHAVRHRVVGFGDERYICSVLNCSGTKARREAVQNEAGSCDDLDCTNVYYSEITSSAFALLFYRKFRYDSHWWVQAPEGNRRVWYCFCFLFEKGM